LCIGARFGILFVRETKVKRETVMPAPKKKIGSPRLMVVDDDPGVGYAVTRWLQEQNIRSVLASSTDEALQMLRDIVFIESEFDGLLVDYNLPGATGCRIIEEFQMDFPEVPVALMTGSNDITLEMWVRSRHIPLFRKPLDLRELKNWVDSLRKTA
jgi:CheY-like chemotaxis protein